jgi:hypothetical protein
MDDIDYKLKPKYENMEEQIEFDDILEILKGKEEW